VGGMMALIHGAENSAYDKPENERIKFKKFFFRFIIKYNQNF
jgi:hypothetical protein